MFDVVFFVKLLGGLAAPLLYLLLVRAQHRGMLPPRRTISLSYLLFVASRFGVFVLIYFVLGMAPTGDLTGFYYPHAKHVLAGAVPYVDFPSSYGFLFTYISSSVLLVWDSPLALILFAILADGAVFALLHWLLAKNFQPAGVGTGLMLYALCVLDIWYTAVMGNNHVLAAMLMLVGLVLLSKRRDILSGVVMSATVHLVKLLGVFYLPLSFFLASRKVAFTAAAVITLVVPMLLLWVFGIDFLSPVAEEGWKFSSGNLGYLLSAFGLHTLTPESRRLWQIATAGAIGVTALVFASYRRPASHIQASIYGVVYFMIFQVLSPKSSGTYLLMFMPLLVVFVVFLRDRRYMVPLFFAMSGVCLIEQALIFDYGFIGLDELLRTVSFSTVFVLLVQIVVVGLKLTLLAIGLRWLVPITFSSEPPALQTV